jgi:S-formylglutathione hydrolase
MHLTTLNEHACFSGTQGFYQHDSATIGLPMRFAVYRPPQALRGQTVPLVMYLAGLTCNEETFASKGGAQQFAAQHGVMLLAPDTSPRNTGVAEADAAWDFGHGAGFYLDATQTPWAAHWRMESYLMQELLPEVIDHFQANAGRVGVFGHSMGGHGALTLALRYPGQFKSASAFAPIAAPSQCPWGQKALRGYLGQDPQTWAAHDATELIKAGHRTPHLLIDQGLSDKFLATQLHPHLLEAACAGQGQPLTLRRHAGYDHGYYFISSFMGEHLAHHAQGLL